MFITDSLVNIEITGSDRRVDYSHILSGGENTTPVAGLSWGSLKKCYKLCD